MAYGSFQALSIQANGFEKPSSPSTTSTTSCFDLLETLSLLHDSIPGTYFFPHTHHQRSSPLRPSLNGGRKDSRTQVNGA